MKKNYTFLLFIFYSVFAFAQSPTVAWAKSIGGSENEYANNIATDSNGNLYMVGYFNSTVLAVGNATLNNAGGEDILITKHDPNGSLIWAKRIGGSGDDYGHGIAVDANNDVFITGSFTSPNITFGTTTFTNAGDQDVFLAKISSSGNVMWASVCGGNDIDCSKGVATDMNGNVYIAGYFASPCAFGSTTLSPSSNYDAFISKFSSNGTCLWAKAATGFIYTGFKGICTDPDGNAIVVGDFESSTVDFGGITLTNVSSFSDAFVAKYNPSGSILWAQQIHGPEDDFGVSVTSDSNSNIIVGGRFFSSTLTIGANTMVRTGIENAFVAKFNSSGNPVWANSIMGTTYEKGTAVTCDPAGNIYFSGLMSSQTLTIGGSSYSNAGVYDSFIIKYSSSGNIQWSQKIGGIDMDHITSITSDGNSNIFMAGYTTSNSLTIGGNTLTNAGGTTFDIFFAKMDAPTSILENSGNIVVNVVPNPFANNCAIQFNSFQNRSTIQIFDITGREVRNLNFTGINCYLSKEDLNSGVYFLRVIDEYNEFITKKIVIE